MVGRKGRVEDRRGGGDGIGKHCNKETKKATVKWVGSESDITRTRIVLQRRDGEIFTVRNNMTGTLRQVLSVWSNRELDARDMLQAWGKLGTHTKYKCRTSKDGADL